MTLALPRDILNRFERRWSARVTQAESFQARADRLKQNATAVAEGAEPPADDSPTTQPQQQKSARQN
jgi:hypothetical protein